MSQLTGARAVIVRYCVLDGRTETPVKRFAVDEPERWGQDGRAVAVHFRPVGSRWRRSIAVKSGRYQYFTVEVEGEILYDSRADVRVDMAAWEEARRLIERAA